VVATALIMNILIVIPYTPTLIRVRPYNFVRELAKHQRLTLATVWENDAEREALRAFERDGIEVIAAPLTKARMGVNVLRTLPTPTPLQATICWQPALMQKIRERLTRANDFAVCHVEHLRGAAYGLQLKTNLPTVWDSVDCISHLFEQASQHSRSLLSRARTLVDLERTRRYEGRLVHEFAHVLVTSAIDKAALEKLGGRHRHTHPTATASPLTVLANGVDLDYFQPMTQPRQPETLVISGKMSYHANVTAVLHFAKNILPLIWRERPQTQLWIVGQAPPPSVQALAADARIKVTGYVSDLRSYLNAATVSVCPLVYGAGIQNKVLEAMACATPVVSGTRGLGALQTQADVQVLVGETPESFAQHVLRLLADPVLARRIGAAGRQFVESHHSWSALVTQLEGVYREGMESWKAYSKK
jgi:glycosyltransferase involved in cell wall biosynthesis